MKKHIVYYYSRTGNNEFIAEKIAEDLDCEHERIKPKMKSFFLLILMTFLNIPARVKALKNNPAHYEKVIVCSPIWIGHLIAPIRGFLKQYRNKVQEIIYVTVCGSGEEENKTKYGYDEIFKTAKEVTQGKISYTKALSLKYIEDENEFSEEETMRGIKVTNEIFSGQFKKEFKNSIERIKE